MISLIALIIAVSCLAFANGANDNFKGVATLYGSGTVGFRRALGWATVTTGLGSLAAIVFAQQLLKNFSGKGLVDEALTTNSLYLAAVACGAGITVLLATRLGLPISTTHALVGALVGAGWAAGSTLNLAQLGSAFFLPLLISPVLAMAATSLVYSVVHAIRVRTGISSDTCFCIGQEVVETVPGSCGTAALERAAQLTASTGTAVTCRNRYSGRFLGIGVAPLVDGLHFASAGTVSFARGLNDTPKIAALLLAAPFLGTLVETSTSPLKPQVSSLTATGVSLVAILVGLGGIIFAARIAETMSHRVTAMNHGQGLTANLLTSVIVLGASQLGLPVSTTHVSCGALFGIGAVSRTAHWKMIGTILAAWLTTLPLGALAGGVAYYVITALA